jgi:hypothetical protein
MNAEIWGLLYLKIPQEVLNPKPQTLNAEP